MNTQLLQNLVSVSSDRERRIQTSSVVSLVDGRSLVSDIVRIQTSSSKSSRRWFLTKTSRRWFLRLSAFRLAGVSLVDGHTRVSSSIERRFQTSSVVSLVNGGF